VWMDFYNKSILGYGVPLINDLHTLILNWMATIEGLSWGFSFVFIMFIGTYTRVCVDYTKYSNGSFQSNLCWSCSILKMYIVFRDIFHPRQAFEEVFLIWWLNDSENLGYMNGSINLCEFFKEIIQIWF
jgi:hypothetical protein